MTVSDFDQAFGTNQRPPSFTQRVGKAEPATANGETAVGSGAYKPYCFLPSGTINETCEVVRWLDGTDEFEGIEFPYRFLIQVAFAGNEQLRLFLPDCIVVIDGQHLRDLRKKLARRQVTSIQQYSAKIWPNAKPQGEPVIDRIQVVRPE